VEHATVGRPLCGIESEITKVSNGSTVAGRVVGKRTFHGLPGCERSLNIFDGDGDGDVGCRYSAA
jgi:hypothetical protein